MIDPKLFIAAAPHLSDQAKQEIVRLVSEDQKRRPLSRLRQAWIGLGRLLGMAPA